MTVDPTLLKFFAALIVGLLLSGMIILISEACLWFKRGKKRG